MDLPRTWERLEGWLDALTDWARRKPEPFRTGAYGLLLFGLLFFVLGPLVLVIAVHQTSSDGALGPRLWTSAGVMVLATVYLGVLFAERPLRLWYPVSVWLVVAGLTIGGEINVKWLGGLILLLGLTGLVLPTALRWYARRASRSLPSLGAQGGSGE